MELQIPGNSPSADKTDVVDRTVWMGAGVVLIGAWVFIQMAELIQNHGGHPLDESILKWFRQSGDVGQLRGPWWMGEVMRDLTALGSPLILGLLTVVTTGYLVVSRRPHAAWLVTLSAAGGGWLNFALKEWYDRPRPELVPPLTVVSGLSFPSGHAQISTIVYLTVASVMGRLATTPARRVYILGMALLLSVLVGISRVALGVHYPTDVLAGWIVGVIWSLVLAGVVRFLQQTRWIE
ncbi:MAG: phosphatase PAP2 family protein [Planctomycetaceae bacterium]|jgi:undecaprenyl-diphosphatase